MYDDEDSCRKMGTVFFCYLMFLLIDFTICIFLFESHEVKIKYDR